MSTCRHPTGRPRARALLPAEQNCRSPTRTLAAPASGSGHPTSRRRRAPAPRVEDAASHYAGEVERRRVAANLVAVLRLCRDDVDGQVMRTGEHLEIIEVDGGDAG